MVIKIVKKVTHTILSPYGIHLSMCNCISQITSRAFSWGTLQQQKALQSASVNAMQHNFTGHLRSSISVCVTHVRTLSCGKFQFIATSKSPSSACHSVVTAISTGPRAEDKLSVITTQVHSLFKTITKNSH